MSATKVRSKTAILGVAGTSVSATLAAAVTAGNLIAIQHSWTTNTVADNAVPAGFAQAGEIRYSVSVPIATALYLKIADGTEGATFAAGTGAVSCFQEITVVEFTGGSGWTLDATVLTNSAGGVTTMSSPTATTTGAEELVLYAVAAHGTGTWQNTWTNGFTRVETSPPSTGTDRHTMGYLVTAPGSYTTAETVNAARSMVGVMAAITVTPTAQSGSVSDTYRFGVSLSGTKNATPQTAKPISDVSNVGAWAKTDGVTLTGLFAEIDDVSTNDADYIISPNNPTAAPYVARLGAVTLTGSNNGWRLRVRHKVVGTGSTTCTVAIKQGATTIMAARSCALTAGFVDEVFDLDPAEAALITNGAILDAVITAG